MAGIYYGEQLKGILMNELLVVFSHGKESGPLGSKIRAIPMARPSTLTHPAKPTAGWRSS